MYVLTLKWSRKKAVLIIAAAAIVLAALVIVSTNKEDTNIGTVHNGSLFTNDDRLAYLASLGWECDPECIEEKTIVIPRQFNEIYEQYNTLQLAQGFDLRQYQGLEVTLFAYKLRKHPDTADTVMAQLIIHNGQVIGGDIHSTAADGFMDPLLPSGSGQQ